MVSVHICTVAIQALPFLFLYSKAKIRRLLKDGWFNITPNSNKIYWMLSHLIITNYRNVSNLQNAALRGWWRNSYGSDDTCSFSGHCTLSLSFLNCFITFEQDEWKSTKRGRGKAGCVRELGNNERWENRARGGGGGGWDRGIAP